MTNRKPCPNCGRPIAADLLIYRNERGYAMVALGLKCKTCLTVFPDAAAHLMSRAAEVEASRA